MADSLSSCTRPEGLGGRRLLSVDSGFLYVARVPYVCVSRTQGLWAQHSCEDALRSGPAGLGWAPTSRSRHQPSAAWGLPRPLHTVRTLGLRQQTLLTRVSCWEPWSVFRTQLPCSHAIGPGGPQAGSQPRTLPEGFPWEAIQSQLWARFLHGAHRLSGPLWNSRLGT